MGKWAKKPFGRENIGRIGIVLAGGNGKDVEKKILNLFDEVLFSKEKIFHSYLVRKGKKTYPLIVNLLGAPSIVDVLAVMHEGGCRNVIFIGYAYGGFQDLEVGTYVIPSKAYHFEGIYHTLNIDKEYSVPDKELLEKLKEIVEKERIQYVEGNHITVPAVTLQPSHNNKDYKRIKPITLDMELAACFHRAKDIGIRAAGILIVSDNKRSSVRESKEKDWSRIKKIELLTKLVKHLSEFNLEPLKNADEFDMNENMARIIADEDDTVNVYKEKS